MDPLASQTGQTGRALRALGKRGWVLLPLLAACSALHVYTAKSPTAPFGSYHSYAHGAPEKTPKGYARTPLTDVVWTKVQADIDLELADKGYRRVDAGADADLVVRSGSGARTREQVEEVGAPSGEDPWVDTAVTRTYTEGTLAVDVFDTHTHQLVWHGSAREAVNLKAAAPDRPISEAVHAVLHDFPKATPAPG
jgi:hypothetical protein